MDMDYPPINNREDYLKSFRSGTDETTKKDDLQFEALKFALDIRKFEIDLYWKRATYFWAFIAASFAGYFALINANSQHWKHILIVSVLGFLFSYCWYFVNRGSKFWQNNWERHVDYLEDEWIGPLYKTVHKPRTINFLNPISAYPISVSKINQALSLLVSIIWMILISEALSRSFPYIDLGFIILIELTAIAIFTLMLFFLCRSALPLKNEDSIFVTRELK
ncbi:hypothetical protein [Paenibacillus anseongense]|uniref:RipA family octameric membrane protein n=1 Tax=Paenibacillus anseongense TaxID=2682845 RepID=UPI002DBEFD90|nr:hypothetical protein [Paenibacillus anseongense]MEC0269369.1 hypothetical protein [Paenibacillus anseongense]